MDRRKGAQPLVDYRSVSVRKATSHRRKKGIWKELQTLEMQASQRRKVMFTPREMNKLQVKLENFAYVGITDFIRDEMNITESLDGDETEWIADCLLLYLDFAHGNITPREHKRRMKLMMKGLRWRKL
jgi:hypothetical protein